MHIAHHRTPNGIYAYIFSVFNISWKSMYQGVRNVFKNVFVRTKLMIPRRTFDEKFVVFLQDFVSIADHL